MRFAAARPSRHELIDSRDKYDPRSLDPALSTDVPTGRAVGYSSTASRASPERQGRTRARRTLGRPRRPDLHLPSPPRRHVPRRHAFTAQKSSTSWQRALDPATKGGAAWPLYPDQGRQGVRRRQGEDGRGLAAPNDTTVVVTLTEPFAIFPKLLAMPVASIVPRTPPGQLRRASRRHRAVEARRMEARRLPAVRPQPRRTGAARRRPTRSGRASSPSRARPSPSSRAATWTCSRFPQSEARDWEEDESASRC